MNAEQLVGMWKWAKREELEPEEDFEVAEQVEIAEENAAIKEALNLLIQELTVQRDGTFKGMKLAIEEKVQKRVEEEVEELLADEQRSTVMGQWA